MFQPTGVSTILANKENLIKAPSTRKKKVEPNQATLGILKPSSYQEKISTQECGQDAPIITPAVSYDNDDDLVARIDQLNELLHDSAEDLLAEREKRKRKERSLIKLAKEIQKRNQSSQKDQDRMEELEEKVQYLEHHWILAQKELDQERILRAKQQQDHQFELERILQRQQQMPESSPKSWSIGWILMSFLVLALAVYPFVDRNVICAPAMPGRSLSSQDDSSFHSPWWVPPTYKEIAVQTICSRHDTTTLEWLEDGKYQRLQFQQGDNLHTRRGLIHAEVMRDRIRVWNKWGVSEDLFWRTD